MTAPAPLGARARSRLRRAGLAPLGEGRWGAVGVGGAGHRARRAVDAARPTRRTTCASSSPRSATRPAGGPVAWALGALRDGLRARARRRGAVRLPAGAARAARRHHDAGEASLALRLAALCAEEGERRAVQRRIEVAFALERFLMGGGRGEPQERSGPSRRATLVREIEGHLRALLRDVLCGYLEPT